MSPEAKETSAALRLLTGIRTSVITEAGRARARENTKARKYESVKTRKRENVKRRRVFRVQRGPGRC
jgi:hypothetical protein